MVKKLFITFVLLILTSCSGGSGGGGGGDKEVLSITPETACGVNFTTIDRSSLSNNFETSISGIISGTSVFIDAGRPIIVWGVGSVLKWGTIDAQLGYASLTVPDTITFVVQSEEGEVVFGTSNGIGIAGFNDSATFAIKSYKELENGAVNGIKAPDGFVYFMDSAGNLLRTKSSQITEGRCVDLVRKSSSWTSGQEWYPTRLAANSERLVVILQNSSALPSISTGIEPAMSILREIYYGSSMHQVRVVGNNVGEDYEIEPTFGDSKRSAFIPTGIAFDGSQLLIAGLAYDASNARVYAETKCASSSSKIDCLWGYANNGELQRYKVSDYAIFSNRLIKINPETNEIERTQEVYLEQYNYSPAPALIAVVANDGTYTHLRGTSYQLMLSNQGSTGWAVKHSYGQGADNWGDVTTGWPHQFISDIEGGAVVTAISPKKTTSPAYSTLEHINASGARRIIDQTSSDTKILGIYSNKYLLHPKIGKLGGKLYVSENNSAYFIIPPMDDEKNYSHYKYSILNAAYDQTNLKLAYTFVLPGDNNNIKINTKNGLSPSTKSYSQGQIKRSSNVQFADFPTYLASDTVEDANIKRQIADMLWKGDYLYILFYGFDGSKHYFRSGRFKMSGNTLDLGSNVKYTNLLEVPNSSTFKSAKILKISPNGDSDTIFFSTPKGIYHGALGGDTNTAFTSYSNLVDISIGKDDFVSALADSKIYYVKLVDGGQNSSYLISSSIANGTTALLGSKIFVALPNAKSVKEFSIAPSPISDSEEKGSVANIPFIGSDDLYFTNEDSLIGKYSF